MTMTFQHDIGQDETALRIPRSEVILGVSSHMTCFRAKSRFWGSRWYCYQFRGSNPQPQKGAWI